MTNFTFRFTFLLFIAAFIACDKDDFSEEDQFQKDIEIIDNYLSEQGLTAQTTASGLRYIIEEPGIGTEHPVLSDTVKVSYKGYFTNGTVFDGTDPGQSITFPLENVIAGWQEGIQLFKKNGKGMLLIPSKLGYGTSGSFGGVIPGNTVILFDIQLHEF